MVLWYPMGVTEILTSCSRAALNFYGHIVRTFSFGTHGEVPWSYTYHILHPRGGTEIWISCSRVLCSSQCKCARPSCLPCSLPPATCLFLPCLLLSTLHVITHDDSWCIASVMMTSTQVIMGHVNSMTMPAEYTSRHQACLMVN